MSDKSQPFLQESLDLGSTLASHMRVKKYEYQGPIPRIPVLIILGKVKALMFIKSSNRN